jgi:hypothetical protein
VSRYKNTSGHPRDLDDGRVVASGDFVDISKPGPVAQHHIDVGHLVEAPKPGGAATGDGASASSSTSKAASK